MRKLEAFVEAACDIAGDLQEDARGVAISMLVRYLRCESWTGHDDDHRRLQMCLDIVGVAVERCDGKRVDLRRRSRDTGPLDQALRLRDCFTQQVFGPTEGLSKATLARLASFGRSKTADRAGALGEALELVGFKSLGTWETKWNRHRLIIRDKELTLEVYGEPLRLAAARRVNACTPVASDELLERHFPSFQGYTCAAQRDAVHAVVERNGPEVVIARMPTGSGKSLLYLLASAEWRRRGEPATTIVVSPVIALMNDQVRKTKDDYRFTRLNAAELNSTVDAAGRSDIYWQLRQGKLDALFLAPEKLVDPFFQQILIDSADHVRLFVVDEAHMVAEWGQDFRPDFFRLGVVRNRLLQQNPGIKTLMLSATLTTDSERTLLQVFRNPAAIARFEEPALRKEISIRVIAHSGEASPTQTLLVLLRQVPRPCIVYCSRREHVRALRTKVRQLGIRRFMDYMGSTPPDGRRERLEAYHCGDVDFVLATNAFGLGVDKADVRSVIHYDVPRNLDEYYQEIGRAARDHSTGHAFLLNSSRSMANATKDKMAILTTEIAAARAQRMLDERFDLAADGSGACLVPLHALPGHIQDATALNRNWNFAVLNILEQMGDIEVDRTVLRTVRVRAGANLECLDRYSLLQAVLAPAVDSFSGPSVDLGKLSVSRQVCFSQLEGDLIAAVLDGAIELIQDDEASEHEREEWVLVRRRGSRTWSPDHTRRLGEHRKERLELAGKRREELVAFLGGKGCRMSAFETVYGYKLDEPCGHCDGCDTSLSLQTTDLIPRTDENVANIQSTGDQEDDVGQPSGAPGANQPKEVASEQIIAAPQHWSIIVTSGDDVTFSDCSQSPEPFKRRRRRGRPT